jgi:hypothetical protein
MSEKLDKLVQSIKDVRAREEAEGRVEKQGNDRRSVAQKETMRQTKEHWERFAKGIDEQAGVVERKLGDSGIELAVGRPNESQLLQISLVRDGRDIGFMTFTPLLSAGVIQVTGFDTRMGSDPFFKKDPKSGDVSDIWVQETLAEFVLAILQK